MLDLGLIEENNYNIYSYGFELLLSIFTTICTILVISIFTQNFFETLFFLIGFLFTRVLCGGYHAPNHLLCFLLTLFSYLLFLVSLKFLESNTYAKYLICFFTLFSVISVAFFAPIENRHNPMTSQRKMKIKKLCIVFSFFLVISLLVLFLFKTNIIFLSFYFGVFITSLSIVASKIDAFLKKEE